MLSLKTNFSLRRLEIDFKIRQQFTKRLHIFNSSVLKQCHLFYFIICYDPTYTAALLIYLKICPSETSLCSFPLLLACKAALTLNNPEYSGGNRFLSTRMQRDERSKTNGSSCHKLQQMFSSHTTVSTCLHSSQYKE